MKIDAKQITGFAFELKPHQVTLNGLRVAHPERGERSFTFTVCGDQLFIQLYLGEERMPVSEFLFPSPFGQRPALPEISFEFSDFQALLAEHKDDLATVLETHLRGAQAHLTLTWDNDFLRIKAELVIGNDYTLKRDIEMGNILPGDAEYPLETVR